MQKVMANNEHFYTVDSFVVRDFPLQQSHPLEKRSLPCTKEKIVSRLAQRGASLFNLCESFSCLQICIWRMKICIRTEEQCKLKCGAWGAAHHGVKFCKIRNSCEAGKRKKCYNVLLNTATRGKRREQNLNDDDDNVIKNLRSYIFHFGALLNLYSS